jgi:hypothetical protein
MLIEQSISYINRASLDEVKWNNCIDRADNGLIYGYSFYLDKMASHWDALVLNDYEVVMPLPWRQKWSIAYLYQPFLTAQLGVFGKQLSPDIIIEFLSAVPRKFRYWDFPLNYQNVRASPEFPLYQRMNFVLPLNKRYEELYTGYRENIKRNIKKSNKYGSCVVREIPLDNIINLTKMQAKDVRDDDYTAFALLYQELKQKGRAKTYGVVSKAGDLLASAAFLFSHGRAYYLLVGNHPNGRTLGASHALIDAFIRDHAGQNFLLDFEGSDFRNLAFFYSSFGAKEERYAAIRLNRLPWWARWRASPTPSGGGV